MARFARRRLRVLLVAALVIGALIPLGLWLRDGSLVRVEHVEIIDADEAVAMLQAGGQGIAVASNGTLLRGSKTNDLPVVALRTMPAGDRLRDRPAARAVRLLAAAPASLRVRVQRMVISESNYIALMHEGPKLYFGDGARRAAKWSAAARVLADSASRGAGYVDLRLPERPVAGGLPDTENKESTSSIG